MDEPVIQGSAIQGASYKTGEPFDSRGPGTSDLDVVLLGDEAMAAWEPEAFYLPGVNTQPLDDSASDIADPRLDRARRAAYVDWAEQVIAGCRGVDVVLEAEFDLAVRRVREGGGV